jgi:hypothetical protein
VAATVNTITGKTAKGAPFSISAYNAANGAVGTFLPVALDGQAGSNHPQFAAMPEEVEIQDFTAGAATGQVAFYVNSRRIFALDYAAHQVGNTGRNKFTLRLDRGDILALKVEVVLPA